MGLQIAVVIGKRETYRFDVGRYSIFTEFRVLLTRAIRGEDAAKKYKKKCEDIVKFGMTKNPSEDLLIDMFIASKRFRFANESEPEEPDLDILLDHSDCSGSLSKTECAKLLALFEKHAEAFKKNEGMDEHFQEVYNEFIKAFQKVVKSRSDAAQIIFS
jgi:hypothetical protein